MRFVLLFSIFVLVSCSSLVQKPENRPNPQRLAQALSGELVLGHAYSSEELPNDNLFGLTEEMKRFADKAVAHATDADAKVEALHRALLGSYAMGWRGITYSAYTTNTGIEAFESRHANCLSYSLLFASMARYLGLNAEFNQVMLPPTWDMRDDNTYLFMRHLNVKVLMSRWRYGFARVVGTADVNDIVIDLEMRRYRPNYTQNIISNDLAAAEYYSNRGMELAANGDIKAAFLYLRKALLLNKDASYIWSNLGSFYRRLGYLELAEAAYLQGLGKDESDPTVMHNLAGLYFEMGNQPRQQFFMDRVRKHRELNPYYQYKIALDAVNKKGDYARARDHIEKAIKMEKGEPRFYRLAAEIYDHLGEDKAAAKMRTKLAKLEH